MFKGKFIPLAIAVATVCSLPAFATDGTITFNGQLTAQTCTINVNGSGASTSVQLPTISVSALTNAGSVAGRTPFTIALTNCTPSSGNVFTYFEPSSNLDATNGTLRNLAVGNGATNVDVQLLTGTYNPLDLRQGVGVGNISLQGDLIKPLQGGAATMQYYAQYYATGVTTAGAVNSSTTYSIIYQ